MAFFGCEISSNFCQKQPTLAYLLARPSRKLNMLQGCFSVAAAFIVLLIFRNLYGFTFSLHSLSSVSRLLWFILVLSSDLRSFLDDLPFLAPRAFVVFGSSFLDRWWLLSVLLY